MTSTDRFADTPVADRGTPESTWSGHTRFPTLDLGDCPELMLVAPHPDDEVLGMGAAAAELAAAGTGVTVVSVTDGSASHPGSPTLEPAVLAARRRDESDRAAACLDLPAPTRLGLPDGDVASYESYLADRLADTLTGLRPGAWCAAPFRHDGHPDHEAVGRAAARAARSVGAVLVEYPVWLWHWSFPNDPAVPWQRARSIPLSRSRLESKVQAVQEFRTQIAALSAHPNDRAVLPPHVLERLLRDHETVFVP